MTAWQTQREWAARGLGGQAAPRWGLPRLCTEAWSPPSRCWHSDGARSSPATWPPGQGAWNPGASSPLSPPVLSQLRGGGAGGWDPPPAPPRLGHGRSGLQGGCWAQVAGPRLAGGWAEVEWEACEGQRGTLRRQGARTPALTPSLLKHPLIMLALVPQDPCLWAPHGGAGPRSERQEAEAGCGDVPRTHRAPGSGPDRSARRGAGQEWARLRTGP